MTKLNEITQARPLSSVYVYDMSVGDKTFNGCKRKCSGDTNITI
jgi:hypothetical protein